MSAYQVSRCICHKRSFEELRELADQYEITSLEEMMKRGWCGGNCGLCHPYVRLMLCTGKTVFTPDDLNSNTAS